MNILKQAEIQRSISQKERDALPDSDFAGPHESFPIRNQHDVDSAAKLIGHADDPEAVKRKIIEIAKRKGLSLPESWQDEDKEDKGKEGKMEEDEVSRATAHLPHDFTLYLPFTRVSPDTEERREIVGIATKEVKDAHGTIISYEASKKAFARWAGNIREQHDEKKAVGHAIEWIPDDENQQILLRAFISKGAEDTWQKTLDGTLTGFSVHGYNAKYSTIRRGKETIPVISDYDMVEVSIVDNPSCPVGPVAILRAEGFVDGVLASDEEIAEVLKADEQPVLVNETPEPEFERVGKTISSETSGVLHDAMGDALASAVKLMRKCNCPSCQKAAAILDPDNDGDIDFMNIDDTDGDAAQLGEQVERMVSSAMAPVYARMQAYLGEFSRRQSDIAQVNARLERLERSLGTLNTLQKLEKLDEVLGIVGRVEGQIERIASTPMPGGPHTGKRTPQELPSEHDAIINILEQGNVPLTAQQRATLVARTMRPVTVPMR